MSKQFFSGLSQNYMEILEDNEYYDVTIEVGEDPNVKIFRAHMIILTKETGTVESPERKTKICDFIGYILWWYHFFNEIFN
ncbi:BTB/POZ protein [Rhizophagus irregularis DAOM 181602=DAOM 197198]|nr:BTB/POZ protein [Rhizophagus irregularis DAOM 181602=DAOM 197198]